ncbi:phosphotransferase enzyme family [Anaerolinea thermolimosa]|uniref:phosphotransferase family protein n=1 Tax=Anaerolinea thermolimosa TaxID=229919 RepID=UPI0007842A23|nr:phosphotransferase [Anaerolinea thermolimosa]GAP06075.1 phosphotransferase enzyme family [Anaerolinea thermolimosa]
MNTRKREVLGVGRTAEILSEGEGKVLKLFYAWVEPEWANFEFMAARLAFQNGVPMPQPFELVQMDGRFGIVYERARGPTLLAMFSRQPWRLSALIRGLSALQAGVIRTSGDGLPPVKRSLEATTQRMIESGDLPSDKGAEIMARMRELPDGDSLCHMDFHPDNLIFTERGWMIIDWMNARCGSSLADIARSALIFQIAGPPSGKRARWLFEWAGRLVYRTYLREVQRLVGFSMDDLKAWLLPVAAARLAEGVPGEKGRIVRLIQSLLM